VELLTPIEDPALQQEVADTLARDFADDTFAWELHDESWQRRHGGTRSVHRELMERALEASADPTTV
jgi:polyphosphate kinase